MGEVKKKKDIIKTTSKVVFPNMLASSAMIVHRIQDIFSQIQKQLFLEFNQSIPNTPSRCFNFSFSVESDFNLIITLLVLRVWHRVRNKDLKTVRCCSWSETSESFNWRTWSGSNPWNISQIWTLSTLEYCFSGAWESLISKAVSQN